jgi:eukaryotic-like serine/threonine-protein kinase
LSEPRADDLVTSKIRLVKPLGAGGMGSVWLADHLALHTHVVVKFMVEGLAKNKEAIARFEREAAAAAQVKSPHVVQILDHGVSDDGAPFIVMELLEGRDLSSHIEKFGRIPVKDVAEIVAQLCRALARAHERGIVHRDIKPQNIFLCDAGSGELFVKLLDFGIAKGGTTQKLDESTKTGTVVGSPYYMSPEQLVGAKDIDFHTDLWSVGVVAFEAMTGTRAFDGETMGALALRIHNEAPPRPSERCDALTPAVDAWFLRACARSAKDRFSSAKEMADALLVAVTGDPTKTAMTASGSSAAPVSNPMALANTVADSAPMLVDSNALSYAGVERPDARTKPPQTRYFVIGAIALAAAVAGFAGFKLVSGDHDAHVSPASSLVFPASATVSVAPPLPATTVPLVAVSAPAATSVPTALATHTAIVKAPTKPAASASAVSTSRPVPTGNEDDIK